MSDKRYCLQCGAELSLMAVPTDDKYPSDAVPACSACGSKAYDVPGNIIQELKGQRLDLLNVIEKLIDPKSDLDEAFHSAYQCMERIRGQV